MRGLRLVLIIGLFLFGETFLFAQTNVSVPVGDDVYYLLDLAEARGLCAPLPAVKPYSRAKVVDIINEILAAEPGRIGGLSDDERKILESARAEFSKGKPGLDPWKGKYRIETQGKKGFHFDGDMGISMQSLNSAAYYQEEKQSYVGTDTWGTLSFNGDMGDYLSFGWDLSAGLMRAQRNYLGNYDTFATELTENPANGDVNQRIGIYSQPKAFFPYTYQKSWDGFIFGPGQISADNMESWPQKYSIGPSLLGELSGSFWSDTLSVRFGRIQREWGGMIPGSSLVFNAAARPFLALEATFNPVPWFSLSSLTGELEYYNANGIVDSAMTFQNMFGIGQVEFNHKNYFHVDFGSTVIFPKRIELGYLFPLQDNYLYQNFIGDFDNMAIFFNTKLRYPGLGGVWFSFFLDEAEVSSMIKKAFKLDREMFAYQAGLQGMIPGIPFASLSLSYTKIEPYCYTHPRVFTPWYSGDSPMEEAYVNNGVSLGYYLPPNSDEVKVRTDVVLGYKSSGHFQYQMIRHGADYGPHQVDGSSLISELDPVGRSSKISLTKSFLKDGAYQWMHIIKFGGEHKFGRLPLTVFGDIGLVYSYFTDISDAEYNKLHPAPTDTNRTPQPWTPAAGDYLKSTSYIMTLGIRIYK